MNFHKNLFYLEDEIDTLNDLNIEDCANYTIQKNYQGFTFKGGNNKCLLFDSERLNNKNDENVNKYNIKTFLKTKDVNDMKKLEDQLYSSNFFEESNNYGYMYDGIINEYNVSNLNECMDKCVRDNNNCKSIMYLKEPYECTFFNKKIMKNKNLDKKFEGYDVYAVKKDSLKNYKIDEMNKIDNDNNELDINNTLYNCSGLYSTNPFCTNEYNPDKIIKIEDDINYSDCIDIQKKKNYSNQKKIYNNICREKYGDEYIFDDNVLNKKNIIKCDEGERIKCKLNFNNGYIEHFNNNNNNNILYIYTYIYIFLFIIGLFFIILL
jgi:hypothetical protein